MLEKGSEIELQVEDLAFEGKGIARRDGFVVFVRGAVPGDTVRAKVLKVKKNFAEASVSEIISPSAQRVEPPCKYFGTCGGCQWQHLHYDRQLEYKRQQVLDAFERIGGFQGIHVEPTVGAEEIYFYRNKIEFSFSDKRWLTPIEIASGKTVEKNFAIGFHVAERFDKVLSIDECLLQSERSNSILNVVKDFCKRKQLSTYNSKLQAGSLRFLVIREGKNTGDLMINLVTFEDRLDVMQELRDLLLQHFSQLSTFVNTISTRKAQVASGEREVVYYGDGTIQENIGKWKFKISANSFFQTNTKQAEKLFTITKALAEFHGNEVLYDLYSGTGTLSLFMSDAVKKVVGIELIESAAADAKRNAEVNKVTNCSFLHGDLKDKLTNDTQWISENGKPDVIILDPPRSGLHPKVTQGVAQLLPARIVYVSCNPATQARDVKALCATGYSLEVLQPVDMFPQTFHIENIVKLVLKN